MAENRRQLERAITGGWTVACIPPRTDAAHDARTAYDVTSAGDAFVPNDGVPYPAWNRPRGMDGPERTGADPHRDG